MHGFHFQKGRSDESTPGRSDSFLAQKLDDVELFSTATFKEQIPLTFWDTMRSGWPIFGAMRLLRTRLRSASRVF